MFILTLCLFITLALWGRAMFTYFTCYADTESLYGYVPIVLQSEGALFGIRTTASIYPAITFLVGVMAPSDYGISRTLNVQIQHELADRRTLFKSS